MEVVNKYRILHGYLPHTTLKFILPRAKNFKILVRSFQSMTFHKNMFGCEVFFRNFMPDCSCFTHDPSKKCFFTTWLQGGV